MKLLWNQEFKSSDVFENGCILTHWFLAMQGAVT